MISQPQNKMIAGMQLKNFTKSTQETYLCAFFRYYMGLVEKLGEHEVRIYLLIGQIPAISCDSGLKHALIFPINLK